MFTTAIAGSLPKPAWLAETEKLWPQWKTQGPELQQAKADATLLWIKQQEDAGLDVIGDGEQARQHFVHGLLMAWIIHYCLILVPACAARTANTALFVGRASNFRRVASDS